MTPHSFTVGDRVTFDNGLGEILSGHITRVWSNGIYVSVVPDDTVSVYVRLANTVTKKF